MARQARSESLCPHEIQIAHTINRCVRRAFLCGEDKLTGKSFDHRRGWIIERLKVLASIFAIDCLTCSVMQNHLHLILRTRPDIVKTWTNREVVERWLRLCPPVKGEAATEQEIQMVLSKPALVEELRTRLSDISWWMRLLQQTIAIRANKEDGCTGRFWEGRFKSQLLLDEAAILACAAYVDLNPIRAAIAESLEDSKYTGAKARIDDLKEDAELELAKSEGPRQRSGSDGVKPSRKRPPRLWERDQRRRHSIWMSPIEIDEANDPIGPDPCSSGKRASLKGFLSMPMVKYLELLDWTGRQLKNGKRGAIPSHVAPILKQLGIVSDRWLDLAGSFGKLFKQAVGSRKLLSEEAHRRDQQWLQGPGADCFC